MRSWLWRIQLRSRSCQVSPVSGWGWTLSSVMAGFSMLAMSLVIPQLLQLPKATGYGLGQSMVVAGLCLGPSGLAMMLVAPLSARLAGARGPKASLLLGMAVIAGGYGIGVVLMGAVWQVVLVTAVIASGVGFAYGAMPALIMAAVPLSETASANGLNSLMRSIGTSSSSAVMGVLLAHMTVDFGGFSVPSENGLRVAMGVALAAFGLAVLIPGRRAAVTGAVPAAPVAAAENQDAAESVASH
jgi:MFS family permease